jgi:hypothetical protein
MKTTLLSLVVTFGLAACAPEPGSDAWCEDMAEQPKGDWSMNDAAEFAKSCLIKIRIEAEANQD